MAIWSTYAFKCCLTNMFESNRLWLGTKCRASPLCRCLSDWLWDCFISKSRQWKWPYPLQFLRWEISLSSRETDDYTQFGIVSYCFNCPNESDVTRRISLKFNKTKFWSDSTAILQYIKSKRQTTLHVCGQSLGSDTWWLRTFPVELWANKHQPSWRCQPRTDGKGVIKERSLVQRP